MATDIQNPRQEKIVVPKPIHVTERGFTIIHDGESRPDFDIVFIHGIQGHPLKTWTHDLTQTNAPKPRRFLGLGKSGSGTLSRIRSRSGQGRHQDLDAGFWPAHLLKKDFPDARILTYGYDSQVSNFFGGGANQNDIVTIANGFLNDLAAQRVNARGRDMMIVSHSMGGLITKEALRRASVAPKTDSDLRDVLNSTFALIFFGTPHRGGAYTNLGLTIMKMAKAAGFSVNDQNIRDLKGSSPVLTLIREGFDQLLESNAFHISTFQESVGYTGFSWMDAKVVPNESSEIGHPTKERKYFINTNHMNMCRFRNAHDDGYIKTKGEIERHLERRNRRIEDVQGEFHLRCLESFNVRQMSNRVLQIENAHRETLKWLYEEDGPGLSEWLGSGSGIFWIQGKAGSGKSTATKFLLENPQTLTLLNQSLAVGSWLLIGNFFTDRADRIQASWEGILHDMIYQLLGHCPALIDIAYAAYFKRRQDSWDIDILEKLLLTFFTEFDGDIHVCFLIDALDEHDGQHGRMSDFLHELVSMSTESKQVKVVVASRPHNDLKDLFAGDRTLKMQEWTRKDIQIYVAGRLSRQPRWQSLKNSCASSTAAEVERAISNRAQGVFLWVRLVVDELMDGIRDGLSLPELQAVVSAFPDGLDDFFGHMLLKVKKEHYQELVIIVETLLRGGTPTAEYLLLVLSTNTKPIQPKDCDGSDGGILCAQEMIDPDGLARRLQSRCGGLVEVARSSQNTKTDAGIVVQFLHQTVKEYFLERRSLESFLGSINYLAPGVDRPNGHYFILRASLEWLKMTPQARAGLSITLEGLPSSIFYHAEMIESQLNMSPTNLLQALDSWMSKQSDHGVLWPVLLDTDKKEEIIPPWLLRPIVAMKDGQMLLLAPSTSLLPYYIQETLTDDMTTSICASGVTQFGYLTCRGTLLNGLLLDRVNFLINCGVDVSRSQTFNNGCPSISMDALGIFVSLHATCYYSDDETYDPVGHMAVLRRLLELSTDPSGWCVERTEAGEVPLRLAEHFLVGFGNDLRVLDLIRVLDLLWDQASKRSLSIADLFGRRPSQICELLKFQIDGTPATARWLFNHGATISSEVAEEVYEPFMSALQQKYGGSSFAEIVQSFGAEGKSQEMLEETLLQAYGHKDRNGSYPERYHGYQILLASEFRQPQYYEADARKLASVYNPVWSSSGESGKGFWRFLSSFR